MTPYCIIHIEFNREESCDLYGRGCGCLSHPIDSTMKAYSKPDIDFWKHISIHGGGLTVFYPRRFVKSISIEYAMD